MTARRFLAIIVLFFFVVSIGSCGGGGGGITGGGGTGGNVNLMEGAVLVPDSPGETTTVDYPTGEGTLKLTAAKGRVVVQFNLNSSESDRENLILSKGGSIIAKIPKIGIYTVAVQPGSEMSFIATISQNLSIAFADPDFLINDFKYTPTPTEGVDFESFLQDINAPKAWGLLSETNLSNIEVGVIDSGFNGVDKINGEVNKDFEGRLQGNIPSSSGDHGTWVTAVCCGTGDNGFGNVGVNWSSKITLKKHNFLSGTVEKLTEMVNEGVEVINISGGYFVPSLSGNGRCDIGEKWQARRFLKNLSKEIGNLKAVSGLKFLVVAAAGNENCNLGDNLDDVEKPDNLIIVGGADRSINGFLKNAGSNHGKLIDIAAPHVIRGVKDYFTNAPKNDLSGTSYAAPQVAGAAALVWAREPSLTPQQIIQRLKSTANGSIPEFGGAGVLDVYKALGGTEQLGLYPPTGLTATPKCSGSTPGIELKWNPVNGATGYRVTRFNVNDIMDTYDTQINTNYLWDIYGLRTANLYKYHVWTTDGKTWSGSSIIEATAPNCGGYTISGKVTLSGSGLSGVTITLTGSGSTSTTTDSNGNYAFTGAQNISYTITPSKSGYTFEPQSRSITVNNADATGQNFIATATASVEIWPMFGHDAQHTGRSAYVGPAATPSLKWSSNLFDSVLSQSVVGPDGTIYGAGSYLNGEQNIIWARNASTGTLKRFTATSNIYNTPAVDSYGVLYFGDDSGYIYALNSDFSLKWKKSGFFGSFNYLSAPPTIGPAGNIYMVGTDSIINNAIICVGPDGALKWKYKPSDTFVSSLSPAIGTDGTIYIGVKNDGVNGTGGLVALNADGTLKWKHTFNGLSGEEWKGGVSPILTPAIGSDSTIYIGTLWYFYAINPDGSLKWLRPTSGNYYSLAVPAVGPDGTVYIDLDGVLSALRPETGATKWTFTSFGSPSSAASVAVDSNGIVYAGSRDYLYAIKPDGSQQWRFYSSYAYFTSPKIGQDGTIYVHHELYKLSALK